ncbi:MAG: DUF1553 domain-containing protein [Tepidisphaeraceae bacterium]
MRRIVLICGLLVLASPAAFSGASAKSGTADVFQDPGYAWPRNRIDPYVVAKWRKSGIAPAAGCSDAVFLRRVYLGVIGTLPTATEASEFLLDDDQDKRRKLIDRLLDRPEFVDYWAMKWGDVLRVKAEFPIILWPNAAQTYTHWIRQCVRDNKPLDQFARELLTAGGSNFRVPPSNFYRAVQSKTPRGIAQAVALTFMGARADKWPQQRLDGMAEFFSQVGYKSTGEWKEEVVFFNQARAATRPSRAVFPDGTAVDVPADRDPRQVFADWLLSSGNEWFARAMANRIWFWLMGRGIIQEPDDIRPDNPPSNPELLAYLQEQLVAGHYDAKRLFRLILNSQTFQLSCIPADRRPAAEAQFASYPIRRLGAEVFIDALCQITGSTEDYSTETPEPFTFIPTGTRTIALPDGSISSAFLDMFGRPPRDTGMESERNNRATPDQRLHLLNSNHIRRKLEQSKWLQSVPMDKGLSPAAISVVYLTILSRFPTADEIQTAMRYSESGVVHGREPLVDLAWALVNSSEFAYQH